jgi:hypothetical protein
MACVEVPLIFRAMSNPGPGSDLSGEEKIAAAAVEEFRGPHPNDAANFRAFVNHHWGEAKRRHGHTSFLLSRAVGAVDRGAPPQAWGKNKFTEVFACSTDGKVHVSIMYWGHPAGAPLVTLTPLAPRAAPP